MDHDQSTSSRGAPLLFAIATLVMNLGFGLAGIALLYLIYGVFFGLNDFNTWVPERQSVMNHNIDLAGRALIGGLAAAAVCSAIVFWFEEVTGYLLVVGAAVLGLGFPLAFPMLGGSGEGNRAVAITLALFPVAATVPGAVGIVLVIRDFITRIVDAVQRKALDTNVLELGTGAKREDRPIRTSILGKCWEGPYCRETIRAHCPIYVKRAACWKERRGCYCEEDIVTSAGEKNRGMQLNMAADSRYNYANPSNPGRSTSMRANLTPAQKAERCRNCVIYNEHQREKYQILLPVTMLLTLVVCVVLSTTMRHYIGAAMGGMEQAINRFSFTGDPKAAVKLTRPGETAEWVVVGALSLMVLSKTLQVLEWAIFEKKV